jgi:hypothetical protein
LVGDSDVISVFDGAFGAARLGLGGEDAGGALGGTVPVAHLPAREAGPEEVVTAREKATHVYGQLSDRELLLRMGDQDVRAIGEEFGLPKSTVFDAVQRVRGILTSALEHSDDAQAVLRELELMAAEEPR